jgi:hypothetical protein
MSLETLVEFEVDRFRRKDLEVAGWVTVDVDQSSRKQVNRPSVLGQFFSTVVYAVNPNGVARHMVRGCVFSEPEGRNKLECNVELTLSFPETAVKGVPDQVRTILINLIRFNLNPIVAVETLVKYAAAKTQSGLKDETIYDFDGMVLPRFKDVIVDTLRAVGLNATVNTEWGGYSEGAPYALDDIVVPFRIPGVARRLDTKLICEIVADQQKKAVIACLRPDKDVITRVAKEAIASFFDDEALFSELLSDHRSIERACETEINKRLKPYAHRVRGFALSKPQGLPDAPFAQIQVDVDTPIQLTDSETPVPLKHTAQLALSDRSKFIIRSLDQEIDPKEYAVMVIRNAAAKLLQGKTFVDLVQAFVLDPLNVQRKREKPKLDLGEKFSTEIKASLKDIGYDIHHIATTPKAKLVEFLIQSPYITLTQRDYHLKGGAVVVVDITFNGNLTSLDAIRGRMTLETDPAADMQADLPAVAQTVLSGVTPFEYDVGTPLSPTGENWLNRLKSEIKARLEKAYGFSVHNLQTNPRESEPRAFLRKLQAGGAHSFPIDNFSPGDDGQSRGLRLNATYSIREPRLGDEMSDVPNPLRTYERYIEASLYALDPESIHARVRSAVSSELNEILNQLSREMIQAVLLEGKFSRNAIRRDQYSAILRRAREFVSDNFGLLIDLSVSVESDDPQGLTGIILESDAREMGARLQIESKLRISKAEAAVDAWGRYHEALTKYDPETADEGERKRLAELKQAAQELEREAEMGKRAHIGRQLQSKVPKSGGLDPSRVLGLNRGDSERRTDGQEEVNTEDMIDLKTQKT